MRDFPESLISFLAGVGWISISSLIAYPLLKWKAHEPRTVKDVFGMFFLNFILLGGLPIAALLMRTPPKKKPNMSIMEADDYCRFHEKGEIWIWNKWFKGW